MLVRILLITILIAGLSGAPAGAEPESDSVFSREYIQTDHEIFAIYRKQSDHSQCTALDTSSLPDHLSGYKLIARAFVETNETSGYVTWLISPDGGHIVYLGNYNQSGCIVSETRLYQSNHYGDDRWVSARDAYNQLLMRELTEK